MTDSIFFLGMAVFIVANGLQNSTMGQWARTIGSVQITMVRNLSLFVTMIPLLLLVPHESFSVVTADRLWPFVFFGAVSGFIGYSAAMQAFRYLPMAVSSSIRQPVFLTLSVLAGMVFFGEYLSLPELALIIAIGLVTVALAYTKNTQSHLAHHPWKGIVFSLVAACGHSGWFFSYTELSRHLDPLTAIYVGEAPIGIAALLYVLYKRRSGERLPMPSWKTCFAIALLASLTILSSGAYAIALNHGPHGLAAGLVPATIIVMMVMGYWFYKESLSRTQVLLIFATVALIGALRLVS